MRKAFALLVILGLVLMQSAVFAQSNEAVTKASPVAQPLIREGDLAIKLVEVLKLGKAKDEVQAETMLGAVGVAPKNGWIADYPVTPDVIGELQKAVSVAAVSKRLLMGNEDAMKAFRTATVEAGLPIIAETGDNYQQTQYQCNAVDNYYSTEGPPVVTYCSPPPDYGYLYAWVPYPFFFDAFFFPGFFILHDFHKVIIIDHRVVVVTNHFFDPKTKTVALIDPVKRSTGKGFLTTMNKSHMGFASSEARRSAASIRNREQMASLHSSMRAGNERGMTSESRGMSEGSFRSNERSFSSPSMGGGSSFGGFHGGGFSGHGGRR